jgi:hypothetical protein
VEYWKKPEIHCKEKMNGPNEKKLAYVSWFPDAGEAVKHSYLRVFIGPGFYRLLSLIPKNP